MITDLLTLKAGAIHSNAQCRMGSLSPIGLCHFKSKSFHGYVCCLVNKLNVGGNPISGSGPLDRVQGSDISQKASRPLQRFHHIKRRWEGQATDIIKRRSSKKVFKILEMHLWGELQIAYPELVIVRRWDAYDQFMALIGHDKDCISYFLPSPYRLLPLTDKSLHMLLISDPNGTQNCGNRTNGLNPGSPLSFVQLEMGPDHPGANADCEDRKNHAQCFFPLIHAISFQKGIVA
jgi:hypothetical protein